MGLERCGRATATQASGGTLRHTLCRLTCGVVGVGAGQGGCGVCRAVPWDQVKPPGIVGAAHGILQGVGAQQQACRLLSNREAVLRTAGRRVLTAHFAPPAMRRNLTPCKARARRCSCGHPPWPAAACGGLGEEGSAWATQTPAGKASKQRSATSGAGGGRCGRRSGAGVAASTSRGAAPGRQLWAGLQLTCRPGRVRSSRMARVVIGISAPRCRSQRYPDNATQECSCEMGCGRKLMLVPLDFDFLRQLLINVRAPSVLSGTGGQEQPRGPSCCILLT